MTSAERVLATLAGRPVDRRPVAPVLSLYGARLTGCPLERYYNDAAAYADGQAAVGEAFRPDVLFAPFDFAALGAAFGSELQHFEHQAPVVRRPALASAAEWGHVAVPDVETHPRLRYLRGAVRRLAAAHGGTVPVVAVLPPPTDLPLLVLGMEGWLEAVLFDPPAAARILDDIVPFFVRLANALFAEGASLLALTCALAAPAILPRKTVQAFVLPVFREALSRLRGPVLLHHGGNPLVAHLDLLAGLPGVVGFALDHRDDLGRGRAVLGSEPVLLGGPSAPDLPSSTPEETLASCRAVLEDRRGDPRFVLCSTGPDIPWDALPETIHALRRAAEAFGPAGGDGP